MGVGASLALFAIGAILAFATRFNLSGIDIRMIGWILMLVGLANMAFTLLYTRPRRRGQIAEAADDTLYVVHPEEPTAHVHPGEPTPHIHSEERVPTEEAVRPAEPRVERTESEQPAEPVRPVPPTRPVSPAERLDRIDPRVRSTGRRDLGS